MITTSCDCKPLVAGIIILGIAYKKDLCGPGYASNKFNGPSTNHQQNHCKLPRGYDHYLTTGGWRGGSWVYSAKSRKTGEVLSSSGKSFPWKSSRPNKVAGLLDDPCKGFPTTNGQSLVFGLPGILDIIAVSGIVCFFFGGGYSSVSKSGCFFQFN